MMYIFIAVLMAVGLYGLIAKRNLIKKILGLIILEHAINTFLLVIGYRSGGRPPILQPGEDKAEFVNTAVDPLPQAMVLTSIVIGLGVLALLVALCVRLYERYGTFDVDAMRRLRG